jgi:hypothetical protein
MGLDFVNFQIVGTIASILPEKKAASEFSQTLFLSKYFSTSNLCIEAYVYPDFFLIYFLSDFIFHS